MVKREITTLLAPVLFFFLLSPIVSAALTIEPPASIYNVGDNFNLTIKATRTTALQDFILISLTCPQGSREIYRAPLSINEGGIKNLLISAKFDKFLVGDLKGDCSFEAKFGEEQATSPPFKISDQISLTFKISEFAVTPGNLIFVSGSAIKENSQKVEGIARINIQGLNLDKSEPISAGNFLVNLTIPYNAKAESYNITISASENNILGQTTNYGETNSLILVRHVPKKVEIALISPEVAPGADLTFTPLLYDQSEETLTEDISIKVYSPSREQIYSGLVQSSDSQTLTIQNNATPGIWTIEAKYSSLSGSKQFTVKELENLNFQIQNNTLSIQNEGNIHFSDLIEVEIGNDKEILPLDLKVGGIRRFLLSAPTGEHEVKINRGNSTIELGQTYLEGEKMRIKELNTRFLSKISPWIWWIILIIILLIVIIYYYMKTEKSPHISRKPSFVHHPLKKEHHYEHTEKSNIKETAIQNSEESKFAPLPNLSRQIISAKSEQKLTEGKKDCAIISVYIKNIHQVSVSGSSANLAISEIESQARASNVSIYQQGSHKIFILQPREGLNISLEALSLAESFMNILEEHNNSHALKIQYGIGVHKGPMFVEIIDKKPKFTSSGNTILVSKRLSLYSSEAIRFTEEIYRNVVGKIRAEKVDDNQWTLSSIRQKKPSSEFINKFMKRNRF